MANDDFQPDDPQHEIDQHFLYELIGFGEDPTDPTMHDLFWDVMYNDELTYDQRVDIYEQLSVYLYESYGLDFENLWSWEDFREWYDA